MQSSNKLFTTELTLLSEGYSRIMGLDEVGRGCLAGPVVAAGVILDPNNIPEGINDSKQLSAQKRESIASQIVETALFWTIQECSTIEIDEINILWASLRAMEKCVNTEGAHPDYLLIDGNRYIPTLIPHQCIVKGDSKSASIAAASILAKVYRDKLMKSLHDELPYYNWDKNVGYPTAAHYKGLLEYGITEHHRKSFNLKTVREFEQSFHQTIEK
jgi:ribonuclease HII